MSQQQRLRWACQSGDHKAVAAALSSSTDRYAALALHVYGDGNSALHCAAMGRPAGHLARLLLRWPDGINPAPHDAERGTVLSLLLKLHPRLLLYCSLHNRRGATPTHLCVQTASVETLRSLTSCAIELLGVRRATLLLSSPDADGRTALDLALSAQMWDAVHLLSFTAPLSYFGVLARHSLISDDGGGRGQEESTTTLSSEGLFGIVGRMVNGLWDTWGGTSCESDTVENHKRNQGVHYKEPSSEGHFQSSLHSMPNSQALLVLRTFHDVMEYRQQLVKDIAQGLEITSPEAVLLLQGCRWDTRIALRKGQLVTSARCQEISSLSVEEPQQCIVCFDVKTTVLKRHSMPCKHFSCHECWKAMVMTLITDGTRQVAACPEPQCRLPLSMEAAEFLLPPRDYVRYKRLVAEAFVASNDSIRWCPSPGCSASLRLSDDPEARGLRAAASDGRGIDATCMCGHSCCWTCGETAHEPATCSQSKAWERELAELRAAAPESSRIWLERHARQCPICGVYVQRDGGCNHMSCSCGSHWCWQCGRPWKEHNADTGGFYFCTLAGEAEPGGGGGVTGDSYDGSGWLREVWRSLSSVASQETLQRALRQHLRHECDPSFLNSLAEYLDLLWNRVSTSEVEAEKSASHDTSRVCGPQDVGISLTEAASMSSCEWAGFVGTACSSAVDYLRDRGIPALEATYGARDTINTFHASQETNKSVPDFRMLAKIIIEAHAVLQRAAAVLRALPGGPRRRYVSQLCDSAEQLLMRIEPKLLNIPYRQEALLHRAGVGRRGIGWVQGLQDGMQSLAQAWYSLPVPTHGMGSIQGLPAVALMSHAHYVMALGDVWLADGVQQDLVQLRRSITALKDAGRSGLFAV